MCVHSAIIPNTSVGRASGDESALGGQAHCLQVSWGGQEGGRKVTGRLGEGHLPWWQVRKL